MHAHALPALKTPFTQVSGCLPHSCLPRGPLDLLKAVIVAAALMTAAHANDSVTASENKQEPQQTLTEEQVRTEVMQWLERMALAIEQLNYQGTFVYQQGSTVRLLRIEHHRDHRGIRERMYSVENRQLEILRDNNLVQALSPATASQPILNYSQFTRLPARHLLLTTQNYRFKLGAQETIAGYPSQQILILPVDSLRYGFEYWLELRTGMLLKQLLRDKQDRILEKLLFTDIDIGDDMNSQVYAGPDMRSHFKADKAVAATNIEAASGKRAAAASPASRTAAAAADQDLNIDQPHARESGNSYRKLAWQCINPPRGYSLIIHQQSWEDQLGHLDHLLYSDGLSQISIYVQQNDGNSNDVELPSGRSGVMNIYRRAVDDVTITVLGAAPYRTLRMLGGSMVKITRANNVGDD